MLTRLFLIAVFWYAVFRFIGRVLRFLAGPAGSSVPAGGRAGAASGPRPAAPRPAPPRTASPDWDHREVIDVEYEEVPPPAGERQGRGA